MHLGRNKNGIGFAIEAALVIALILFSGGTLVAITKEQFSKSDEKFQVEACKVTNEINFGIREKTANFLSGPGFCNTIDKHTNKKSFVPTSKYKQNNEGAETEIRDMIKNCWDMWLTGAKPNTFKEYPFSEGCFTCYTFKIKEQAKGVTFKSLEDSMEEPFFVKDKSDKCTSDNTGGFWRSKCLDDEKPVATRITSPNPVDSKCCVKSGNNICENMGGKCSSEGKQGTYQSIYDKWECPNRAQSCYVKSDDLYSYTKYIREFGPKGGEIFFTPPDGKSEAAEYVPGDIYAINFVSPSRQICYKGLGETDTTCYAAIGGYVIVGVGLIAGGGIALAKVGVAKIAAVVGTRVLSVLKLLRPKAVITATKIGGTGYVAEEIGLLDTLEKKGATGSVYAITMDVPNMIIVSDIEHAKDMGCAISYGS